MTKEELTQQIFDKYEELVNAIYTEFVPKEFNHSDKVGKLEVELINYKL